MKLQKCMYLCIAGVVIFVCVKSIFEVGVKYHKWSSGKVPVTLGDAMVSQCQNHNFAQKSLTIDKYWECIRSLWVTYHGQITHNWLSPTHCHLICHELYWMWSNVLRFDRQRWPTYVTLKQAEKSLDRVAMKLHSDWAKVLACHVA